MPLLKYEQIAESLRARITEGEFGPGELLPSGRELAEEWGVSRATVVKAMDVLRNDGVVVARQGSGFAVVERPLARPAGRRRPDGTRIASAAAYRLLGNPVQEVPPSRVATALDLTDGEHALRRTRLMLLDDGSPASLVDAWFPPSVSSRCPRLVAPEPLAEGTTRYVARRTGRAPAAGTDLTTARLATEAEAEVLGLELPAAVVVVLHSARDEAGAALVCEVGVTPAELWEDEVDYPMGS
ncbi:GntR family transcriptional regulator [Streptomyces sp. NPDC004959]|uniref:GntR family transcriptional regulator n=1 Tax=unclassified Streptomyces TaxID=2593676 RepID=UPI0004C48A64|nr:GntR family transcriptional regulator [Streptomyces sp. NRRL F-5630]